MVNKERLLKAATIYRVANIEARSAYYHTNRRRIIDKQSEYNKKHITKIKRAAITHLNSRSEAAQTALVNKLESQNFLCALSGLPIELNEYASVDHLLPQSKYPELKHSINNLHWTDIRVNRMKRDMELIEFVTLCKAVYEHNKHLLDDNIVE